MASSHCEMGEHTIWVLAGIRCNQRDYWALGENRKTLRLFSLLFPLCLDAALDVLKHFLIVRLFHIFFQFS